DMTWAALRGLYSFPPHELKRPSDAELRTPLRLVDYRAVRVNAAERSVALARRGMALGTGGIAEGYALDRAGAILRNAGLRNFMLFGGGQVQVEGMRGDRPWRVGIQHPRDPSSYFAFLEVRSGSLSTSGDYEHFFF